MGAPDGASILDIEDDYAFQMAWHALTAAERSAIGAAGLDRFNKLTSYIDKSVGIVARAQAKVAEMTQELSAAKSLG